MQPSVQCSTICNSQDVEKLPKPLIDCFHSNLCWCSVTQSRLLLCDPVDYSTPGFPVFYHLPKLAQTHAHWVSDAIRPSHPLSSPSLPVLNLSQHQGLFKWVSSSLGGQSIGVSASTSVFPVNSQDWSPLRWTGWTSLQSKGLTRVFSNTVGSQCEKLRPWQRSWGRRLGITQRRDRASGDPLFPSIYPQNQSLPTLLLYALTYTSDFMGGCPPPPLSEKELNCSSS